MLFDYETMKLIWWVFIGVLLIGFAIADGMDMGVGNLLPVIGKTDMQRRIMINTVGPHWDGNQVWFITAGGAIFAAWPMVYAAAFSGFYFAMLLVLFALFFRPLAFDYRSKLASTAWRKGWDWGLFIGSFVPPLVFGSRCTAPSGCSCAPRVNWRRTPPAGCVTAPSPPSPYSPWPASGWRWAWTATASPR